MITPVFSLLFSFAIATFILWTGAGKNRLASDLVIALLLLFSGNMAAIGLSQSAVFAGTAEGVWFQQGYGLLSFALFAVVVLLMRVRRAS